jgi:hypothetical protein
VRGKTMQHGQKWPIIAMTRQLALS